MKKNLIIASVGLAIILIASFGFYSYKNKSSDKEGTSTPVAVQRGSIKIQILSTGIVQPENKVEIKPPIAGRLDRVLVSEGTKVKKGQILAWMSSTERAALLDAATSRGDKELKEWEEMYRATPVLAPINGMIIQKNFESGQTFTTNDAVLVMSDRLTVKAQVDETDIAQIKLKQKAIITLDAYSKKSFDAIVDQIAFDAKTVNNVTTYLVDVLPNSAPEYMRSGMTANVVFDILTKENILTIPAEAIKTHEGKSFVLVAQEGEKKASTLKEVELGITDGKKTEILKGLAETDKVMVPEFKLKGEKSGGSPFSPMGSGRRPGH